MKQLILLLGSLLSGVAMFCCYGNVRGDSVITAVINGEDTITHEFVDSGLRVRSVYSYGNDILVLYDNNSFEFVRRHREAPDRFGVKTPESDLYIWVKNECVSGTYSIVNDSLKLRADGIYPYGYRNRAIVDHDPAITDGIKVTVAHDSILSDADQYGYDVLGFNVDNYSSDNHLFSPRGMSLYEPNKISGGVKYPNSMIENEPLHNMLYESPCHYSSFPYILDLSNLRNNLMEVIDTRADEYKDSPINKITMWLDGPDIFKVDTYIITQNGLIPSKRNINSDFCSYELLKRWNLKDYQNIFRKDKDNNVELIYYAPNVKQRW